MSTHRNPHRGSSAPAASGPLLARQRQRLILEHLRIHRSVRVAPMAAELGVAQETIRRDLEFLETQGHLLRAHGGAVPYPVHPSDRVELPLDVRETVQLARKRLIAAHAVKGVGEHQIIALDASSTACELARLLPDLPLSVVTSSLAVASALADRRHIRVIVTGGVLDGPSRSFVGDVAGETLGRFHFTTAFLSCQGIDIARGLSVTADEQAGIKRRMIALAESVVLLADSSKFGLRAVEYFAKLSEVDRVITDPDIDRATLNRFRRAGVQIEIAPSSRLSGRSPRAAHAAEPAERRA